MSPDSAIKTELQTTCVSHWTLLSGLMKRTATRASANAPSISLRHATPGVSEVSTNTCRSS